MNSDDPGKQENKEKPPISIEDLDEDEHLSGEKINAMIILEILGRPPEHLKETLDKVIETLSKEKNLTVKSKKIHDPVEVKDVKDLYTTYADIEISVNGIMYLLAFVFKYMPSHIEIMSPEKLTFSNNGWNEILNEISLKLNKYEELAKIMQNERLILETKFRELSQKYPELKEKRD